MALESQSTAHVGSPDSTTIEHTIFAGSDSAKAHIKAVRSDVSNPSRLFRYRVIKRALDIFLVVTCSPVLLLLFGLIAAAIRIDSEGPVFFSHRRIRRSAEFFSMWKFRTMCVNSTYVLEQHLKQNSEAHEEWLKCHKLRFDPRVTRVGGFLRRTSLDELPQLWNVLNGSMSLVGPRPIVAAEVERYGDDFACYCMVKPGITGLWQTSGRSNVSYQERVQFDCKYVDNWSLSGDLRILAKTLLSVADQNGAY